MNLLIVVAGTETSKMVMHLGAGTARQKFVRKAGAKSDTSNRCTKFVRKVVPNDTVTESSTKVS